MATAFVVLPRQHSEFLAPVDPATPCGVTHCALGARAKRSVRADAASQSTYARRNALRALAPCWGRGVTRRKRLCLIRAAARPRAALHSVGWRSTSSAPLLHCNAVPGLVAARIKHRGPRWMALRPSKDRKRASASTARTSLTCGTCLNGVIAVRGSHAVSCAAGPQGNPARGTRSDARAHRAGRRRHRAAARPGTALLRGCDNQQEGKPTLDGVKPGMTARTQTQEVKFSTIRTAKNTSAATMVHLVIASPMRL